MSVGWSRVSVIHTASAVVGEVVGSVAVSVMRARTARQRRNSVAGELKSHGLTVKLWPIRANVSLPMPQPVPADVGRLNVSCHGGGPPGLADRLCGAGWWSACRVRRLEDLVAESRCAYLGTLWERRDTGEETL
jgi:hypothetical protein